MPNVVTRAGLPVGVRPARPADLDAVNDLHRRCSPETRRARYLGPRERLTPAEWRLLTTPAYGLCLVAHADTTGNPLIGYATLGHTPERETVEASLLVEDRWQGAGVGTALAEYLVAAAGRLGARTLVGYIGSGDPRALRIVGRLGAEVSHDAGAAHARLPLPGIGRRAHAAGAR